MPTTSNTMTTDALSVSAAEGMLRAAGALARAATRSNSGGTDVRGERIYRERAVLDTREIS